MVHIYGHSFPVRWGDADESKMVKVYSNCDSAELFLNGASCGAKKRNSQDFPAAGLRWSVRFRPGENHLRVTGRKNGANVADEIRFQYQTEKWQMPARFGAERKINRKAQDLDHSRVFAQESQSHENTGRNPILQRVRLHRAPGGDHCERPEEYRRRINREQR